MKRAIFGVVLVFAIVFAAPAFAAGNSSSHTAYDHAGTKAQTVVNQSQAHVKGASNQVSGAQASGTLPFTGLDLGLIVGAGVLLVGTGLSLRLLTRERSAK